MDKREILQALRPYTNCHRPTEKPNAFIFSMPRSGSTWLQELIWTQPGFKYCNEPLNLKGNFLQKRSAISGFEELYRPSSRDKVVDYLRLFCIGKHHFLDPSPLKKYYRPITNRIVFKIIHGGEIFINDIAEKCNGKVIFLIRHPIAVSLSRKVLPRLNVLCSAQILQQFSPSQQQLARKIQAEGTFLEKGVLSWCIQNQLALWQRNPDWLVITYEQLTVEPKPIIDALVEQLGLSHPERIWQQLNIPSAVTVQSEQKAVEMMAGEQQQRRLLIERWREKVLPEEASHLMQIVADFELDVYTDNNSYPEPSWLLS
jgi:hypothetical protein